MRAGWSTVRWTSLVKRMKKEERRRRRRRETYSASHQICNIPTINFTLSLHLRIQFSSSPVRLASPPALVAITRPLGQILLAAPTTLSLINTNKRRVPEVYRLVTRLGTQTSHSIIVRGRKEVSSVHEGEG
jgi:hypothetical protein